MSVSFSSPESPTLILCAVSRLVTRGAGNTTGMRRRNIERNRPDRGSVGAVLCWTSARAVFVADPVGTPPPAVAPRRQIGNERPKSPTGHYGSSSRAEPWPKWAMRYGVRGLSAIRARRVPLGHPRASETPPGCVAGTSHGTAPTEEASGRFSVAAPPQPRFRSVEARSPIHPYPSPWPNAGARSAACNVRGRLDPRHPRKDE